MYLRNMTWIRSQDRAMWHAKKNPGAEKSSWVGCRDLHVQTSGRISRQQRPFPTKRLDHDAHVWSTAGAHGAGNEHQIGEIFSGSLHLQCVATNKSLLRSMFALAKLALMKEIWCPIDKSISLLTGASCNIIPEPISRQKRIVCSNGRSIKTGTSHRKQETQCPLAMCTYVFRTVT